MKSYIPTLCVTHRCNLNCIYCYQTHDFEHELSYEKACEIIDDIFATKPSDTYGISISFIGGEPLLRFDLLKEIYKYTHKKEYKEPVKFFATTNGTILTDEMKKWFEDHNEDFFLGLSADGTKETHNINRSNSFDKIDFKFFLKTWPKQSVKMTISELSIDSFADDVIFLHKMGFKEISGSNLAEGDFDWDTDENIKKIIPQLKKLCDFYSDHSIMKPCQMFQKAIWEKKKKKEYKKWCGIGENSVFYDTDGKKYPCSYLSPMTFSSEEIEKIQGIDFTDSDYFTDFECVEGCYIYPVCSHCAAANYQTTGEFGKRAKNKCKINKIVLYYVAEMHKNRILKNRKQYTDDTILYYTIEAIKEINQQYYPLVEEYIKKEL